MGNEMNMNKITLAWLNSVNGISNKTIKNLIEYFGSLENLWNNFNNEKMFLTVLKSDAINTLIKIQDDFPNAIVNRLKATNVKLVTYFDDDYPSKLKNIQNAPYILYYRGDIGVVEDYVSIAVVGSRKATSYGKWTAEQLTAQLADLGVTIISGLASGIDTIAHRTALKYNTKTVGVIGCGINIIYPKKNEELYKEIVYNGGAVVTEYPFDMQPMPPNFPNRNRIISGLSDGVLIIEAQEKSGTLITAGHAADQGKDVFAVPGNIDSLYSKGTNGLIKDGAKLVASVQDIIDEIPLLRERENNKCNQHNQMKYDDLNELEAEIVKELSSGVQSILDINQNVNARINDIFSTLTVLEMKGIIKQLPGKKFVLTNL